VMRKILDEFYEVSIIDDKGAIVASGKAEKVLAHTSNGPYIPIFIPMK